MPKGAIRTLVLVFTCHLIALFFLYVMGFKSHNKLLKKNILVKNITVKENKRPPAFFEKKTDLLSSTKKNGSIEVDSSFELKQKSQPISEKKVVSGKKEETISKKSPQLEEKKNKEFKSEVKKINSAPKKKKGEEIKKAGPKSKPLKKKTPALVEKGASVKKASPIAKSLLESLDEALSSLKNMPIETKKAEGISTSKRAVGLKVPSNFSLEISQFQNVEEENRNDDFQSRLAEFFQNHLKLPEYGQVKVRLKIKSGGQIADVATISSKNKKNEEYLKNILEKISIPYLDSYLIDKEEIELVVCFTNDL